MAELPYRYPPLVERDKPAVQTFPFPDALADLVEVLDYRPGWSFELLHKERDPGCAGLTFVVITCGYDAYHVERGQTYRVAHYWPVPPATFNVPSWRRWLFETLARVELHEAMEFFAIDGEHPYAPNHGPGYDPYVVRELTDDEARRTSFRGVVKAVEHNPVA